MKIANRILDKMFEDRDHTENLIIVAVWTIIIDLFLPESILAFILVGLYGLLLFVIFFDYEVEEESEESEEQFAMPDREDMETIKVEVRR